MPFWIVTMFDDNKLKHQFHVAGQSAMAALIEVVNILSDKNAKQYAPSEVHVQVIKKEAGQIK